MLTALLSLNAIADDVLITKNSQKINAKIEEVGFDVIKYRRSDNLTGPIYTIPKSDVITVIFENGTVEVFNEEQSSSRITQKKETENNLDSLSYNSGVYNDFRKLSKDEVYTLYQKNSPEAYILYKKGRRNYGWGIALICIGSLNSIGGAINCVYGNTLIGVLDTGLGLGLLTGGIALVCVGKNNKESSVKIYNKQISRKSDVSFNINASNNGLGFAINF